MERLIDPENPPNSSIQTEIRAHVLLSNPTNNVYHKGQIDNHYLRITNTLVNKTPWQRNLALNKIPANIGTSNKTQFIVDPPY